jgi:hypothetical protein
LVRECAAVVPPNTPHSKIACSCSSVTGASLNELALRASVNSSTSAVPSGAIRLVGLACRDGDVSSGSLVAARLVSRAGVANLKRDRVTNFSLLDYPALTGPRSIWDARLSAVGRASGRRWLVQPASTSGPCPMRSAAARR